MSLPSGACQRVSDRRRPTRPERTNARMGLTPKTTKKVEPRLRRCTSMSQWQRPRPRDQEHKQRIGGEQEDDRAAPAAPAEPEGEERRGDVAKADALEDAEEAQVAEVEKAIGRRAGDEVEEQPQGDDGKPAADHV